MNRPDLAEKQQQIVEQYNAGGSSTENYFDDVMKFTESMKQMSLRFLTYLGRKS